MRHPAAFVLMIALGAWGPVFEAHSEETLIRTELVDSDGRPAPHGEIYYRIEGGGARKPLHREQATAYLEGLLGHKVTFWGGETQPVNVAIPESASWLSFDVDSGRVKIHTLEMIHGSLRGEGQAIDCTTLFGQAPPKGEALALVSDRGMRARGAEAFELHSPLKVSRVRFWGCFLDLTFRRDDQPLPEETFTVSYYEGDRQGPRKRLKTHRVEPTIDQTDLILDLGDGTLDVWSFEATHPETLLSEGRTLWMEITCETETSPGRAFLWLASSDGDGRSARLDASGAHAFPHDLAFCLDIEFDPPGIQGSPANDDCSGAIALKGDGLFDFDNGEAQEDGLDHDGCLEYGHPDIARDVWFVWTADADGTTTLSTCGHTTVDTKIAVYEGTTCPGSSASLIACNDDTCGTQSEVVFDVTQGSDYLIRLGTHPEACGGRGNFSIATTGEPPDNDNCVDAQPLAVPSTTEGETSTATKDSTPPCGGPNDSPGVWYLVPGTGTQLIASLCEDSAYDTRLSVFEGTCDSLRCIASSDDTCGIFSEVRWCAEEGQVYRLLVHGFGNERGAFTLELRDEGERCGEGVGACCLPEGCLALDSSECVASGGIFRGEGTSCVDLPYDFVASTSAFEDIRGSGTALHLGDDDSATYTMEFPFSFFGLSYADVTISSNGYLTFGGDGNAFDNQRLPDPLSPNGLIAVLWDDLDPTAGGSIHIESKGPDGNRRWIVQWSDIPQYGEADANTFQAVLFEQGSVIELRYRDVSEESDEDDFTLGLEDRLGQRALEIDASSLYDGAAYQLAARVPGACAPPRCEGHEGLTLSLPSLVQTGESFPIDVRAPAHWIFYLFVSREDGFSATPWGELCMGAPFLTVFGARVPSSGRIVFDHYMYCDGSLLSSVGLFQFVAHHSEDHSRGGLSNRVEVTVTDGPCD